jgi:hypothetical protein
MGRRTDLLEMLTQFGPFHSTSFYVQYLIKSSNNNLSNFKVILFANQGNKKHTCVTKTLRAYLGWLMVTRGEK